MKKDRLLRGTICLVIILSISALSHLAETQALPGLEDLEDYYDCSKLNTPGDTYEKWVDEWRNGIEKLAELGEIPKADTIKETAGNLLVYALDRLETAKQKAAAFACFQKEIEKLLKEKWPEEAKASIAIRRNLANLKAELIFQRHQTKRFLKVQIFLEQIEEIWEEIETIYPLIISNAAKADSLHQQWLDDFGLLVEEFRPGDEQEQIYDMDEFYSQLDDIQFFYSNVPSTDEVKDNERRTIFYIEDLQKRAQIIKSKIQMMKMDSNYKLYVKYTGDLYIVSQFEKMLASVDEYIVNAENTKQAIRKKVYVRDKMPSDIYKDWTDILASNAVLTMTDDMLQDYSRFLASEGMIIRVSQKLKERNSDYYELFYDYLSPYLAKRAVMADQKYLEILEINIHESFIDDGYKSEIQMEIDHYRNIFNRNLARIENAIDNYDDFKSERKRLTGQYLKIYADYMTETCQQFSEMILADESDSIQVNIEHEKFYRIFKTSCVEEVRQ